MSAIPTPDPNSAAWSLFVDSQNVTFNYGPDGTPINVSLTEIDSIIYFYMELAVSYAFAIGVTGILMIVLLILIDQKKARRPVFVLNFLALFFSCLKAVINVSAYCSQWSYGVGEDLFSTNAQYSFAMIKGPSAASKILELIIYPLILGSLILQIRVVFAAEPTSRLFITLFLTVGALLMYATLFAYDVWILQTIFGGLGFGTVNNFTMLYNIWTIAFVVVVGICSVLFTYKLVVTIRRRKTMGFKSFGPLHVLAIMFGQCLIVPVVLLVVQLSTANDRFSLNEITVTILVASLPLSSLWASHVSEGAARQAVITTNSSLTNSDSFSDRLKNMRIFGDRKQASQLPYLSDVEKSSNLSDVDTAKRPNSLDVSQLSPVNDS